MGIQIVKKEQKPGIRASSPCTLNFDDLKIPEENVIGGIGQGYKITIRIFNEGRIGITDRCSDSRREPSTRPFHIHTSESSSVNSSVLPGNTVPDCAGSDRDRGSASSDVQCGAEKRGREEVHEGSSDGQVLCQSGRPEGRG